MSEKRRFCLLTNDVEEHSIWYNKLRPETARLVYEVGMPLLLDLYRHYRVRSTFFFTGTIAELIPEVVRMVIEGGHEVGCHAYSHEVEDGFDVLPIDRQIEDLKRAKGILEDISGKEVISFRAPALRVNEHTPRALVEAGFRIDSSVASQRFDCFLSFGAREKLKWLRAPRLPYRTDPDGLHRRGDGEIVEVPLTALGFPFTSTTMRIFPRLTGLQQRLLHWETCRNERPVVFDIHPNEFLEEGSGKRKISRRTSNPIKYLISDVLRGKMKVRNLGRPAVPLYERLIQFYSERGYEFPTISDYCIQTHLLGEAKELGINTDL